MSEPDVAAWTRQQVEARLALAREAAGRTDGHWWRRMADAGHFDDHTLEPVGALYAGEPVLDGDGDVCDGEEIVVYDEGRPSDVQCDHIAANDPQDTIARCEAELAILDEHRLVLADPGDSRTPYQITRDRPTPEQIGMVNLLHWIMACHACRQRYPCRTVHLLASGYRHRPGYQEAWKPDKQG